MQDNSRDIALSKLKLKDYKGAIYYFEEAIKGGDFSSAFDAAILYMDYYRYLDQKRPNVKKAKEYFELGFKDGDLRCKHELLLLIRNYYLEILDWKLLAFYVEECNKNQSVFKFDDFKKMTLSLLEFEYEVDSNKRDDMITKLNALIENNTIIEINNFIRACIIGLRLSNACSMLYDDSYHTKYAEDFFASGYKSFSNRFDYSINNVHYVKYLNNVVTSCDGYYIPLMCDSFHKFKKLCYKMNGLSFFDWIKSKTNEYLIHLTRRSPFLKLMIDESRRPEPVNSIDNDKVTIFKKKTQNEDQPKIESKEEINEDYVEIASKNRNKIVSPNFIFTGGLELLNEVENNIYFLDRYYSKKYIEFNQNDAKAKKKHEAFIEGVKNCQYYKYKDFLKLHIYIPVFLRLFQGEWVICTAPGHNKSENMFNGVYNILSKEVWLNKRFTLVAGLLQRCSSVQKRALVKDRSSYFDEDIKTIGSIK